jgi:hypothetical protein
MTQVSTDTKTSQGGKSFRILEERAFAGSLFDFWAGLSDVILVSILTAELNRFTERAYDH